MARSTELPKGVNGGVPTPENPTKETIVNSGDAPKKDKPKADKKSDATPSKDSKSESDNK